jgi:hypothetical protein
VAAKSMKKQSSGGDTHAHITRVTGQPHEHRARPRFWAEVPGYGPLQVKVLGMSGVVPETGM